MIPLDCQAHYFLELGKCKHYEMKCSKYRGIDQDKYERYLQMYLYHKRVAAKYYAKIKENALYSDFLGEESIFADSRYFDETQEH